MRRGPVTVLRCVATIFGGLLAAVFAFFFFIILGNVAMDVLGLRDSMALPVMLLALLAAAVVVAVHVVIADRIWTGKKKPDTESGYCIRCGYDLRGNPSANRCPECGKWQYIPKSPPAEPGADGRRDGVRRS